MMADDPRFMLERLVRERGEDYASLSRLIGRNAAYVQQYIKRGTPKRLEENDRRLLARYFGVAEALLGGRGEAPPPSDAVRVPRLDVGASAGPGSVADDGPPHSHIAFDAKWLRRLVGGASKLSMIRVAGDSMEPTLADGDEILVDGDDAAGRLRDGIYVLRIDEALLVKRVALNPAGRSLSISSDNSNYPGWPDCPLGSVDVVGRVVWPGARSPNLRST